MSFAPHLPWLPVLIAAGMTSLAVVARCATLLIGLLAALSKASRGDRPDIFREFARAVSRRSGGERSS